MRMRSVLFLIFIAAGNLLPAQTVSPAEVKAVFLYNFTSFIDWPATTLPPNNEPLVIGILGEDPFGAYLEEVIKNEKKNGHPLVIKRYAKPEDVTACHILFIGKCSPEELKTALALLKGQSVLTVSDAPDFAKQGGMIKFFIENNKVRIQVNAAAIKNADLAISSKLLRVAEVVNTQTP